MLKMKLQELKSGLLTALLDWYWFIHIYLILSIAIAVTGALKAGWITGLSAAGTSAFSIVAGGGLKAALWWGDKVQKIAGPIIATALMVLAYWLSHGFSVQLFGYYMSGAVWGCIGFVVCFVFYVDKGLTQVNAKIYTPKRRRKSRP